MYVVAVDAEREDGSQRHHAAHRRHVVEVRLRVLDVAANKNNEAKHRLFTPKLCTETRTQNAAISRKLQSARGFHLASLIPLI